MYKEYNDYEILYMIGENDDDTFNLLYKKLMHDNFHVRYKIHGIWDIDLFFYWLNLIGKNLCGKIIEPVL